MFRSVDVRTTLVRAVPTLLFVLLVYVASVAWHIALGPVFNPTLCAADCGRFAESHALAQAAVVAPILLLIAIALYVRGLPHSTSRTWRQPAGRTVAAVSLVVAFLALNLYGMIAP